MILMNKFNLIKKDMNNNNHHNHNKKCGSCHLIIGPMFSSKTIKLTQELGMNADTGFKCLYINHSLDQRKAESSNGAVTTHHTQFTQLSDKVSSIKIDKLSSVNISEYDVIGIDEGQFFSDLNEIVRKWVLKDNKDVIVASLDGDSNLNVFGQVLQLIPISEKIEKLNALCMNCLKNDKKKKPAYFSGKLDKNNTSQIDVGSNDKYIALCLPCYKDLNHM